MGENYRHAMQLSCVVPEDKKCSMAVEACRLREEAEELKAKAKEATAEAKRLEKMVDSGLEVCEVECVDIPNYHDWRMETHRTDDPSRWPANDDGAEFVFPIVQVRDLQPEERQEPMFEPDATAEPRKQKKGKKHQDNVEAE